LLVVGCGKDKTEGEDKELVVLCGSSFPNPMGELCSQFTEQTRIKFATMVAVSENHLPLIKTARKGDIFVTHDPYLDYIRDVNCLLDYVHVGYVSPVLAVQPGNPKGVRSIQDLTRPGLKLGMGDPDACAIGRTSRQILAKNNIAWEKIKKHVAYLSLTVNELGMQIQAKSLDAVIVWDAMARYYGEYGDEVPIAPEKNLVSTVDIGVLKFTINRELAEKFVDFITSERGQEVFKKHNYSTKDPE